MTHTHAVPNRCDLDFYFGNRGYIHINPDTFENALAFSSRWDAVFVQQKQLFEDVHPSGYIWKLCFYVVVWTVQT